MVPHAHALLLSGHPAAAQLHHSVWQPEHRRPRLSVLRVVAQPGEQGQGGGDAGESPQNQSSAELFLDSDSGFIVCVCYPGGQDSNSAAVGHAGGGLHLPADGDGLVGTAGYFARHRHCAAR